MAERRALRRGARSVLRIAAESGATVLVLLVLLPWMGAAPAVIPESSWGKFLPSLAAPSALPPGGTGAISIAVYDPLNGSLGSLRLQLQVYAFNPPTGSGSQAPIGGASPVLGPSGTLGTNLTLPVLASAGYWNSSVTVAVPNGAPDGAFAIRVGLGFTEGSQSYLLESRGFFSSAQWAFATQGPNGTSTLNASRLGVSGVVPETAVSVLSTAVDWALYGLLGVGLTLAAVGGYWWGRSGPGSRSGANRRSAPQSAPSAFGKRRNNDGD